MATAGSIKVDVNMKLPKGASQDVTREWNKLVEAGRLASKAWNKHVWRFENSAEAYDEFMDIIEDVALSAYDFTFALEKEKPVDNSGMEEAGAENGHACQCKGECQGTAGSDIRTDKPDWTKASSWLPDHDADTESTFFHDPTR